MNPLLGTRGDGIYGGGGVGFGKTYAEVVFVGSGGHDTERGEKRGEEGEREEKGGGESV